MLLLLILVLGFSRSTEGLGSGVLGGSHVDVLLADAFPGASAEGGLLLALLLGGGSVFGCDGAGVVVVVEEVVTAGG